MLRGRGRQLASAGVGSFMSASPSRTTAPTTAAFQRRNRGCARTRPARTCAMPTGRMLPDLASAVWPDLASAVRPLPRAAAAAPPDVHDPAVAVAPPRCHRRPWSTVVAPSRVCWPGQGGGRCRAQAAVEPPEADLFEEVGVEFRPHRHWYLTRGLEPLQDRLGHPCVPVDEHRNATTGCAGCQVLSGQNVERAAAH